MLQASLSAGPDFSDSSVDTKVIFFDFALHNKILRGCANDILYRLRKGEHERAEVFRRWRANACYRYLRERLYSPLDPWLCDLDHLVVAQAEEGRDQPYASLGRVVISESGRGKPSGV